MFWLGFYPFANVSVVLFLRNQLRRLAGPSLLDGAVAGLGAASLCAAFAFHSIQHSAGTSSLITATNLAFPIGDLVLLGLVVGGSAVLAGSRRGTWGLLSLGLGIVVVGDTVNLFTSSLAASHAGTFINDVAWPTAMFFMAAALWQRPRPADLLAPTREAGFLLPGLAAACALGIVFVASRRPMGWAPLVLAAATLIIVGVRLVLSARTLKALSQQRHRHSITDELTGLHNRRYLASLLEDVFAERGEFDALERDVAFLFVDLNHFKEINDSFGHPAGDDILRQVGPRFRACLRTSDVVVRLGGDEFVVLLLGGDANYVVEVAKRIVISLEQPFALHSVEARVGASVGVAMASDAADADELMWHADVAMYRAKQGGSGFAVYGWDVDGSDRMRLADELLTAINEGQLVLHYQPQLDLRRGEILGVEALLRWAHPKRGIIPPLQFLPLAEEAGLLMPITRFVLDEALRQAAAWRVSGRNLVVSVNISAPNLLEAGFTDLVLGLLERHQLTPDALVVEITETCVIEDFDRSRSVVEELRNLGIIVSIDDFGAGATSLTYLSSLGVGELKLDRCFITGLSDPSMQRERELVRATIELGHAMGLRVVAEGIEDSSTLDLLFEMGCDLAQGYFISRPKPPDELAFRSSLALLPPPELAGHGV